MQIGEIRLFAGGNAPRGWAWCDGALLRIAEQNALFEKIGTVWGGDGTAIFAIPDLRGEAAMHHGGDVAFASRGIIKVSAGGRYLPGRVSLNFIIALHAADDWDPILGEVRLFPYSFVPRQYEPCDGRLLPVRDRTALFTVLTGVYGGDGVRSFALPDLRGAYVVQPNDPEGRGVTAGVQAHPSGTQEKPLLALRYCIAVEGKHPFWS